MSLTPSNFEQAEYSRVPESFPPPIEPVDNSLFLKALVFGLVGALAGAIVYAAFIVITHISIGYLAIGIAYLVAKGMMIGSGERGGLKYQIAAIVLTCLAVGLGNALMFLWFAHSDEGAALSLRNLMFVLPDGFARPFVRFQHDPFGGAIGLFILFVGLRAAWRMTSGLPGASQHPFSR